MSPQVNCGAGDCGHGETPWVASDSCNLHPPDFLVAVTVTTADSTLLYGLVMGLPLVRVEGNSELDIGLDQTQF